MKQNTNVSKMALSRRTGYGPMLGLTITFTLLAVTTALPLSASKPNILGYVSCCPFAPLSTLVLLALAGTSCVIRARLFRRSQTDQRRSEKAGDIRGSDGHS
jgi:hypothetical protein